jgi:DNA/RNA-binding domain of Phe-tRNA-synthetase-like protein
VEIGPSSGELWQEIEAAMEAKRELPLEGIRDIPEIAASRRAYRAMGKAPSRYRLSAEALHRRSVQGKGLYRINNVVEVVNLVSLETAFSIGGYDDAQIEGEVHLGLGQADDVYEAIGRGQLNIENLPVFRDELGPFGSPTSDSVRTRINDQTQEILLVFLDFESLPSLGQALDRSEELLKRYTHAKGITRLIV